MSDDSNKETLRLEAPVGTDPKLDTLRGLIPANWTTADDGPGEVFEADLGKDLPALRLEQIGDTWVGIVDLGGTADELRTDACDTHNAAALHLRQLLVDHAESLRDRADRILEMTQTAE